MKKLSNNIFGFIKRHKIWSLVIGLVIVYLVWYFIKNSSENIKYTEVPVVNGPISEIVSVTGNVKPLADVNLAFERGGRVSSIPVVVGDRVYTGQLLATVSNADLSASLDRARADLKIAEVQAGNVSASSEAQNSTLATARLNLQQGKVSLINTLTDAYTKGDDAVRNKIFSLFTDPVKYNANLAFPTETFLQEDIEDGKDKLVDMLDVWYRALPGLTTSADLSVNHSTAKTNLEAIKKTLDKCALAVNNLSADRDGVTQTQIDTWKSNVSLARSSIDTTISTVNTALDQYESAGLALKTAENNYQVQTLTVDQARAGVASAEAELAKSMIRSPITGVVTKIDAKLGEIVSANVNTISVISYGDYEVESFIPEADISKIKIGNTALTTLDAYGDSVTFNTSVVRVDPAATVIDGVPTYKVTLKFDTKDERVRSGMTANLDILTNKKADVLTLPSRVIVTKEDGKYVSYMNPADQSEILEKKIITGLRGSDGNVEIVSGLNLGDKVIIPVLK
jgi:multidrug efflux pump subunit AcrA (membrane-fusion protein)